MDSTGLAGKTLLAAVNMAVAVWVTAGPPPVKSHLTVKQAKARVD
jgi:hypothetical protein